MDSALSLQNVLLQVTLLAQLITLVSGRSTLSAPFLASPAAASPRDNFTPATGSLVGSMSSILNSSNINFSWGWVATSDHKFFLSIVYIPGSAGLSSLSSTSGTTSSSSYVVAAGGAGAQQVWMANRNRPVSAMASLQLQADGSLQLRDGDGSVAWTTGTTTGVKLELQNSGNLVFWDVEGNTVWQSFDHPSDTLLPGQVIATGTQVIASVSYSNVSEGKYSVVMEPGGLIMYVATPSGPLPYHVVGFSTFDKNNTVQSVQRPLCRGTTMNYSSGGGIVTFQQEANSGKPECNGSFIIPVGSNDNNSDVFFRLDSDGNFRTYVYRLHYGWGIDQEIFSGSLVCALPGLCGAFGVCSSYGSCSCPQIGSSTGLFHAKNPSDPTSGCALSQPARCNGSNQLVELVSVSYFANDYVYQGTSSLSDCKLSCFTNCSCTVAFYDNSTSNCFHYQEVMSIQKVSDASFHAFVKVGDDSISNSYRSSGSSIGNSASGKLMMGIILCAAFLTALCLVIFAVVGMRIRRRLAETYADDAFLESLPGLPTRFSYKELYKATDGFRMKLGSGGFGSVYEGKLGDGTKIAVKRLESARQGQKEFHAEVAALGSINHLNLVRLRGFCTQGSQRLLVYDYMENGSLDRWLFSGDDESRFLNWATRYRIALDTARGLAFLHEESRERIVHLDVKPQNILLDEGFIAKLADFGLSKLMDRGDQSDVVTNMRGTPGYVAPEWLLRAAVTSKSDVYSYGMVLLELVSGRRNVEVARNSFWYFPAWAVMKVEEGKAMEIVDERLKLLHSAASKDNDQELLAMEVMQQKKKAAERMIKVAMWCIQEDPSIRPCMSAVLRILEGHSEVDDPPSLLQFALRTRSAAAATSCSSSADRHAFSGSQFSSLRSSATTHISNSVLSAPR